MNDPSNTLPPDDATFWLREQAEWQRDPATYEEYVTQGLLDLVALRENLPEDAVLERRVVTDDIELFREMLARIQTWKEAQ